MTNEETIYSVMKGAGFPETLALLIVAQAKHESSNFTSPVFKSCNNAFGYKYVGQSLAVGPCSGSPEGNNYAKYASVLDSAKEIVYWIRRRQADGKFPADLSEITTADHYAQLLKLSGYYGAPISEYINGLIHWFKDHIRPITGSGLLIAAVIVFFLMRRKN